VEWGDPDAGFHETSEDVDENILKSLDACVESLTPMKKAAVRLIYLRETYSVYHSGRMSDERAASLCDEAERELIPMLRAKGVVLGGA